MSLLVWATSFLVSTLSPEGRCLALNVYWEASVANQQLAGQRAVAQVTLARAADNRHDWGGRSLCSVVYHANVSKKKRLIVAEFSWTRNKNAQHWPQRVWAWTQAVWVAHEALLEQTPDLGLAAARYYLNPATSSRGGRCWFEKNLIPVVAIGDHHFYREPTSEERAAGWRPSTPPWCAMVHKYKKFRSRHAAHPLRRRA